MNVDAHLHTCRCLPLPALARYILPEGDGNLDKGMKLEWATEKDGSLVVGSFGKEYTDNEGHIVNTNNNWIITIDPEGVISRQDWTKQYKLVQTAGCCVRAWFCSGGACCICILFCSSPVVCRLYSFAFFSDGKTKMCPKCVSVLPTCGRQTRPRVHPLPSFALVHAVLALLSSRCGTHDGRQEDGRVVGLLGWGWRHHSPTCSPRPNRNVCVSALPPRQRSPWTFLPKIEKLKNETSVKKIPPSLVFFRREGVGNAFFFLCVTGGQRVNVLPITTYSHPSSVGVSFVQC